MGTFHHRKRNLPMPELSGTFTLAVVARARQWPSDRRLKSCGSLPSTALAPVHHESGGRANPGCIHSPEGSPSAVQLLWAGAVPVAPSPALTPTEGLGLSPAGQNLLPPRAGDAVSNVPKEKNPWVTEDDEVCLHKVSAHPLDPELSRDNRILLPGNSIPAPREEQCHCSHTSPPAFHFFSIVSSVCTEFWVLHWREPGLAAGSPRHPRLCRAGTSCLSLPIIILLSKE